MTIWTEDLHDELMVAADFLEEQGFKPETCQAVRNLAFFASFAPLDESGAPLVTPPILARVVRNASGDTLEPGRLVSWSDSNAST